MYFETGYDSIFVFSLVSRRHASFRTWGVPCQVLAEEIPLGGLEVEVRNRVGEGQLNEGCGAEWVQKVRVYLRYLHIRGCKIYFSRPTFYVYIQSTCIYSCPFYW